MGTLNPCRFSILFGLFVILIIENNGVSADVCRKGCAGSDSGKLKYQIGQVYEYSINSMISISLNSTTDPEETSLKFDGIASLYPKSDCTYVLKLDKVHVETNRETLRKQLTIGINKPIQFVITNGELDSQICTDTTDNDYSLNIKRGIISLLQSTDKSYETDIFGRCPTLTTTTTLNDNTNIITKVRNLNSCSYRENIIDGMMTGIVDEKAGIKSSSELYGDYTKQQKLINGIFENVELTEEYKLLSKTNSFINTKVSTQLHLKNVNKVAANVIPIVKNMNTETIIFKHPNPLNMKNLDVLKKTLEKAVNLVDGYAKTDSASFIIELIRLMRHADTETLMELSHFEHPNRNLARKVYLDALFRTATSESVKAIVKQIGKMSIKEKYYAFTSFHYVQSISKDALNQVSSLITAASSREAFLSIGHLVNKYCTQKTCDQRDITPISTKFIESLKHCKVNTKKDENRIIGILKGIRNTHNIADSVAEQLIECSQNDRSTRIRVAAIQSFTAASCNVKLQEKALALLKDMNEDSEIRIEAYLVAVTCPNNNVANEIADILNHETVYQVGGFITTHLKGIRDSTDFTRQSQRHHLNNIRITKKFPIDPRRFSYNSELSYSIESLGVGASADYNLIYSQNGFLPRSGKLNLTSVIFGKSYNIFEINARQENLENIFEYYFGPKGFLVNYKNAHVTEPDDTSSRQKRSITDDTHKMMKKYKTYGANKFNGDMNLDLGIKMFGTEMAFLSLGDNIPATAEELNNEFQMFLGQTKKHLEKFEHSWEYHTILDYGKIVYPTGVGLPLEIVGEAAAATKLQFGIEMDLEKIFDKNNKDMKMRLKIVPSADINIVYLLRIDGGALSTGIRTTANIHTATGGDLNVDVVNDGSGFNVDLKLPNNNLELIDLKYNNDIFIMEQNQMTKSLPFKTQKKRKAHVQPNCFDQLQMFGMTLCYTSTMPETKGQQDSEYHPLIGPAQFSINLQTEQHLTFKGAYKSDNSHQSWQLNYDTPNSQKAHNTQVQFELGVTPKLYAKLDFQHPDKQMSVEGGLQNDNREFTVYSKIIINNEPTVHKIGFTKNNNEYRPLIQMTNRGGTKNDINGYKADGRVLVSNNGEKYDFENFRIITPTNQITTINGWIQYYNTNSFKTELKVNDGTDTYRITSHGNTDPNHSISVGAFVVNEKTPDQTTGASVYIKYADKMFKQDTKIQCGIHEFNLHNYFHYDDDQMTGFKFDNEVSFKNKDTTALSGKFNGEHGPKIISYDFEATQHDKRVGFNVKYLHDQKTENDYDLTVQAKLNRHFIDLKSKMDVKNSKYILDNVFVTSWGTKATAKGDITQRLTAQDGKINLQGTLQVSPKDKESHWSLKMQCTNEKSTTEMKLSRDKTEFLNFKCELNKPTDKGMNGHFDLMLKETVTAKGNFVMTKNGRGTLSMTINPQQNQPEMKIDSKFLIAAPKYDIDTTFTYNTNQKISYKTENIIDRMKFSTKNLLTIGTEKLSFDANAIVKGADWVREGDLDGKFELIIPTGRQFNGNIKRKMSTKDKNGIVDIHLNDITPNSEKRSLSVKGKLTNYDQKTKSFIVHYDILFNDVKDNTIDVKLDMEHLPKGHFKMAKFGVTVGGSKIPDPIQLNVNIDEYCNEHAVFRISGKHGNKFDGNLNGNYQMMDPKKPISYELQMNVNLPQSEHKTYALKTSGHYLLAAQNDKGINEFDFMYNYQFGNKQMSFKSNIHGNAESGTAHLESNCPWHGPLNFDGHYKQEETDDSAKYEYGMKYDLGKHGLVDTNINLNYQTANDLNLHYTMKSSYESAKNIELILKAVKSEPNTIETNTKFQYNNDQYGLNTIVTHTEFENSVDIKWNTPVQASEMKGSIKCSGEHKCYVGLNLMNVGGIDFTGNADTSFQSFDDFYMKINLNSNKLKLNQLNIQANSQLNTDGKHIEFNVADANDKIFNGIAQYNIKQEKGKIIIEGQGTIQYYSKQTNANFKLVRQTYDMKRDGENGFSYNFTGKFGPKNIVSTIKATNKNIHVQLSSCEEKKQCTNFQIESLSTIDPNDLTQAQHKLLILINLLELGYPYEFELLSKTTRNGYKVVHDIEMNVISNNNNKYQFLANLQPNHGLIQFKLPKRSIVLETVHTIPENGIFGYYEDSITFYFDKENKANEKTQLSLSGNFGGSDNKKINGDIKLKLEHPTIRTLSVYGEIDLNRVQQYANGKIEFDIFKLPQQRIVSEMKLSNNDMNGGGFNFTSEAVLKSAGFEFEYIVKEHLALSWQKHEFTAGSMVELVGTDLKYGAFVLLNKHEMEVLLNGLNHEILKINGGFNQANRKFTMKTEFKLFESKPVVVITDMEPNGFKFVMKRDGMFDVTGEMKIGHEVKFSVNGYGKKLYNGKIMLDISNFMATTYEVEDENVAIFMNQAEVDFKQESKHSIEDIKQKFQTISNAFDHRLEKLQKNGYTPDLTNFKYIENVNAIIKELEDDPSLKDIIDAYRRTYKSMLKFMEDCIKVITDLYGNLSDGYKQIHKTVSDAFKNTFLPAWNDLVLQLTTILNDFHLEVMRIFGTLFERTLKSLKTLKADLMNLGKPFAELLQPLGDIISDLVRTLAKEWEEFWHDIEEYWHKLPSFKDWCRQLQERLSKLQSVDEFLGALKDLFDSLEKYPITQSGQEFIQKLYKYIEAKLRNTPINDYEELESLYQSLVQAVRSFLMNFGETPSSYLLQSIPFSYEALTKLPSWLTFRFSPINYFRNEKFDTLSNFISYQSPFDLIPPYELQGHVADGQHIFTFDGRHMTYPGSCKYILAQDYVNNNFSVVANLKDGKMKSITLVDKTNYVEINDKGLITLNNEKTEYPVHKNDIHAWRSYYTVSLLTEYGVRIVCSTDLRVCHVKLNGFYTGQVRGLLGNGNSEPYDDYTKPDGIITNDYSEFGNSYGLGNCKPVPNTHHHEHDNEHSEHHHREEICTEFFGMDSNLRLGYIFIDANKYREACDHAVSSAQNKEDAACNIALAYASAGRLDDLPTTMPERCLTCKTTGAGAHNFGNEFKTNIPSNQADIVFVIDIGVSTDILNNFMQTIIKDVRDQLKVRGMINAHIAVIGYNLKQQFPQLFTTNGKINFDGELKKMNFNGPKHEQITLNAGNDKVNDIIIQFYDARTTLEATDLKAFKMAAEYPFRAGAAKSIVYMRNNEEPYGALKNNFAGASLNYMVQQKGIFLHYIGPVANMTVEGFPADKIVGFNKRAVATLEGKDAKKRAKLHFTSDIGIDLIQDNYGWVFALQNFELQKSREQKMKFTQQITAAITDQLYKTNVEYQCKCTVADGLYAEEECYAGTTNFDGNKKLPK